MKDLIKEFTKPGSFRDWMGSPWTIDNVIRAISGHIAIELTVSMFPDVETVPAVDKCPEFGFVHKDIVYQSIDLSQFNVLDLPESQPKKEKVYPECKFCHGTGRCSCDYCDADHDCGRCDGSGEDDNADSTGERILSKRIPFYNTGVDWKYLDLVRRVITAHPGDWTVGLNEDPLKVIVFRRDGIIIYVMPMRA